MQDLTSLRADLRKKRQSITGEQRKALSQAAGQHALEYIKEKQASRVAVFYSLDEEIDSLFLIQQLWTIGIEVFLPAVKNKRESLIWLPYNSASVLKSGAFSIPIPADSAQSEQRSESLDLVVLPLLGYTKTGVRLGFGGGYYDRTFQGKQAGKKPYLLGLAYTLQEVESLTPQPWDVPLDALANESALLHFT